MQIWRTVKIIASMPKPKFSMILCWTRNEMTLCVCARVVAFACLPQIIANVYLYRESIEMERQPVQFSHFLLWAHHSKLKITRHYKFSVPALIKIYFNFIVVFSCLELNKSIGTDNNSFFFFLVLSCWNHGMCGESLFFWSTRL